MIFLDAYIPLSAAVTDDSLPPFTTRDGNQNTNNHVEAFILSFMRKFMGLVKARR